MLYIENILADDKYYHDKIKAGNLGMGIFAMKMLTVYFEKNNKKNDTLINLIYSVLKEMKKKRDNGPQPPK